MNGTPSTRSPRDAPSVVVGLGRSGLACARHLSRLGETVVVVDSRERPPGLDKLQAELPAVRTVLGGFDAQILASARLLVLSPGVDPREPAVAAARGAGVEVVGEIELFARSQDAPAAAITGSNGKSTVTELLAAMASAAGLRVRVGGNLGTPALELLAQPAPVPDLYVLELSSFQLETTRSLDAPAVALLNVSADHMDRYTSFEAYRDAKARILRGAGIAVLNLDDPVVRSMDVGRRRLLGFSVSGHAAAHAKLIEHDGASWFALDGRAVAPRTAFPLVGRHNTANALAAMAMADALGVSHPAMAEALSGFRGLPHRCSVVLEQNGVRWIDDSKGTNVGATVAAIEGLQRGRNLVLIAGGDGKGQDFSPLADPVRRHVHSLVLIGRDGPAIAAAIDPAVPRRFANDIEEAIALANEHARCGDVVLFSPACASFDMFASYVERGAAYVAAVAAQVAQ